jgi:Ni/Co efflux regulator RcnB
MKTSAIVCAVLADSLGFSTLASAQDWGHRGGERFEHRDHRSGAPASHERFEQRGWVAPRHFAPHYVAPRYEAPRWHGYDHARFYRGGFLPYAYRQPAYYIDWRTYPGLYAPPYGYQWMQVGDDFLLVALASGLIANLLTAQ